jgi:hypothetical protein
MGREKMSFKRVVFTVLIVATLVMVTSPATFTAARESLKELENLAASAQATVTLNAAADATVRQWAPDTNFGGEASLQLAYAGQNEEAVTLVRFDLSSLPPDAVVDSASLRLYLASASGADPVSIATHAVTQAWNEIGDDGVTWHNFPTVAPMGIHTDIDAEVASYKRWPATSYAQAWIDDPTSNHGVMLRGPTDGTNYERVFESREHLERVPQLEITYHLTPYTFMGFVYEGEPGDTSTPLEGATVELWGDQDEWPEGGFPRVQLASDLPTGTDGGFQLTWDREGTWPYLHVIETDPAGAISTGAAVDSPGYVKNANVVSYRQDDLLETGLYDFDGIAFWDRFPEEELPDLIVTDIWPEGTQICFEVQNVGAAIAPAGHQAILAVDSVEQDSLAIGVDLASTATWDGCFNDTWACTGEGDTVVVSADATDVVAESDETNNRLEKVWDCDRTPPEIIAGPTVSNLKTTSAVISWETNEAADSVVRYDAIARTYGFEETDPAATTDHEVTLAGLTPSTTYHFVARSTDPAGNTVESRDQVFQTLAAPDTRNPTVNLSAPPVMTGTVTVRADADDDIDVAKVEFYLDEALVFTDYSPPYEWIFATEDEENGDYVLKTKAIDLYGNSIIDQMTVPVKNFVDAQTPTVDIFFPSAGANVYGDTRVWVTVSDDSGWSEVEWFVDGVKQGGGQYPVSPSLDIMFWWDTRFFARGNHSLAVRATDADGKAGTDLITVNVANAAPPPAPKLVVTKHEVFRHAHTFAVELTVQNQGNAAASGIQIVDALRGFQPIARVFNGVTYETQLNTSSMQADAIIKDPASLAAGASRTYYLATVPVLVHDKPPVPSVGANLRLSYKGPSGPSLQESVKFEVLKTTATAGSAPSEPLGTAHTKAVGQADYLIVTNPSLLALHNPFQNTNLVLSDMAALAFAKKGVLGYLRTSNRNTLDNLIMPNGGWGKQLSGAFRTASGGYVLIVGEGEIVPWWSTIGWNRHWTSGAVTDRVDMTDATYADTGGNGAPELIVGRIIGDSLAELAAPMRTSIAVYEGRGGYGFDRSHALVVSGTGVGQTTSINGANATKAAAKAQGFDVSLLHLSNYTSTQHLTQIQNRIPGRDVIHINEHGNTSCLGPICSWNVPSLNFGGINPIILAPSCLTGDYENGLVAEAFLDHEAGLYFGSTELSPVSHNAEFGQKFFSTWNAYETVGKALTDLERERWSHGTWWQFWAEEYNIYGEPKYGAAPSSALTALDAQEAKVEPVSPVEVVVPDYEVAPVDDVDFVTIPGGDLLYEEGKPQVPYYTISFDYEPGYQVQDVRLAARGEATTETGLKLPITTMDFTSPSQPSAATTADAADAWYPDREIDWDVQQNPDGSVTLLVMLYPFSYNVATTDAEFYKEHTLEIVYTYSDVSVGALTADQDTYQPGDAVAVDLVVENTGTAAQDVVVSAHVERYGSGQILEGLILQTLSGLAGSASFTPQWDSSAAEPGLYAVNVTLKDTAGNILDSESALFGLGIAAGAVSSMTVTSHHFHVGDTVDASLVFENTGSLDLTGAAVIKVRDVEGTVVEEFEQAFSELAPGATVTLDADWDTTGLARGDYALVGYALYDGTATEPEVVTVSTERRIYLPILYRVSP